jgi:hypothetical protein
MQCVRYRDPHMVQLSRFLQLGDRQDKVPRVWKKKVTCAGVAELLRQGYLSVSLTAVFRILPIDRQ